MPQGAGGRRFWGGAGLWSRAGRRYLGLRIGWVLPLKSWAAVPQLFCPCPCESSAWCGWARARPGCVSPIPGVPGSPGTLLWAGQAGEGLEQELQHDNRGIFKYSESYARGRGSRGCAPAGPAPRRAPACLGRCALRLRLHRHPDLCPGSASFEFAGV